MTWLIPFQIALAISLRSSDVSELTDYQLMVAPNWNSVRTELTLEREDGLFNTNYEILGSRLFGGFEAEASTRIIQSKSINRQSISVGKSVLGLGVGLAATSRRYDARRVESALRFRLPLFLFGGCQEGGATGRKSDIIYVTNFRSVNIVDAFYKIELTEEGMVRPYVLGRFYRDGELDWQIKVGVDIEI